MTDINEPQTISQASEHLEAAFLTVREAAKQYVKDYGRTPADLLRIINCNRSGWSGGPYTLSNITESITRQVAMDELERQLSRLPRS